MQKSIRCKCVDIFMLEVQKQSKILDLTRKVKLGCLRLGQEDHLKVH